MGISCVTIQINSAFIFCFFNAYANVKIPGRYLSLSIRKVQYAYFLRFMYYNLQKVRGILQGGK